MAKYSNDRAGRIILRVGGSLGFLTTLLILFTNWNMYDIWGRFAVLEVAFFVVLLFTYMDLTADDSPESKTIYFTHPISKGFAAITLLFIPALAFVGILSIFGINFHYASVMLFLFIFILDVGFVYIIPKVLYRKLTKG